MTMGSRYNSLPSSAPGMTDKIWGWYYSCLVPAFQSRSVADIKLRGVTVTGIRDLDEGLKNAWNPRLLTINEMVDFFKDGVPIRIVKPDEVKDVYDTVQTHLLQWLEAVRTGLNMKDAPIEDLMAMDRFATKLYVHAAPLFTKESLESAMAEHFMSVQRIHAGNFFSNVPKPFVDAADPIEASKKEAEAVNDSKRVSLEEKFKKSMMSVRRYDGS